MLSFSTRPLLALISALLVGSGLPCLAQQPSGGVLVAGSATIAAGPGGTTISQASARAIINWQDFSIAAGQTARFVQPDALSATLNRVVSGVPSSLLGHLQANGSVFLINPNGIVIGAGARIDTGGFLASTLDVSDADFLKGGDLLFRGESTAAVQNLGALNALGGDVFLIARNVENTGTISAANGTAGLAAGSEVLLTTGGSERVFVQAASAPGQLANAGAITAATAELKAAGGNAYALAINNRGVVRATGSEVRDGQVWLVANGGAVEAGGTLAASSAEGARGGAVHVFGERVTIPELARVDVSGAKSGGTVLIGGDFQGKNAAVTNARTTTIAAGARINADATANGDGGRVIVWSDETTNFAGEISARGGAAGGGGGFAEVSGKATLRYRGTTDLRAPQGTSGTLLLDPKDIVIATGGADALGANDEFGENAAGTSTIDPSAIVSALDSASVVLQANNDITVSDAILNRNHWQNSLTFQAGRSIAFNADVWVDGDLIAVANYAGGQAAQREAGDATLTLASGMKLENGDFVHAMTLQFGAGPNGNDPVGAISLAGTLRNALGTLTIATNDATAGSRTISLGPTTTANLTVNAAGDITQTGALSMISGAPQTKLYAGTNDITLTDASNALGRVEFTGGDVTLNHGATAAFTLHGTATGNLAVTAPNILAGATLYGGTSAGGTLTFTTNNALQFAQQAGQATVSTSGGASGAISIQAGGRMSMSGLPSSAVSFSTQGAPVSLIVGGTAADLSLIGSSITTNGGAITLRSNHNVLLNQATLTSGGGNVILNSDADASGVGSITLAPSSAIRSNGGRIELAGGSAVDANGYLTGRASGSGTTITASAAGASGILVNGATINSGGGAIRLLGQSSISSATDAAVGIFITSATTIDAGTGTVLIDGLSRASGGSGNMGINLRAAPPGATGTGNVTITSANTSASAITINGQGPTSGTSANSSGINLQDATSITATGAGGGITLTGTGGVAAATSNNGINFENGTGIVVAPTSGALTFNGTAGNASGAGIKVNGTSTVAIGGAGMSGGLTLTSDTIDFVSSNVTVQSTGDLLVQPLTSSQAIDLGSGAGLSLSQSAIDAFADGFRSITIGAADGTGAITVNAAISFKDPITLRSPAGSGSITVDGALSTGSGSEAGSVTLQAGDPILLSTGNSITTAGQPVTLNADRDANGSGSIAIDASAAITTSGGAITLGGGSDPVSNAASGTTYGVRLRGSLDAGSGAVTIRGEATATTGNNNYGVNVEGGSVKTSGAGAITIVGTGAPSAGNTNYGVGLNTDAAIEATGAGGIAITGTGGGTTGSYYNDGVAIHWGSSIASMTGAIAITGTAGITTGANSSNGVSFQGSAGKVESTGTAAITLTGTGVGSASSGLYFGNASAIGGASAGGGITLTADTMNFGGSPVARSSGALLVQPLATSTTIGLGSASGSGTLALAQSALNTFADGFSSITIGRSDGSGTVTVGSATFLDAVELRTPAGSGAISINGALNAGVNRLTLNAAAGATQTGALTAGSLLLKGAENFTLTNTGNAVETLAANVAGALSFTNGAALTIGSVDGTTGVSTGAHAATIRTTAGNLTLAQPVTVSGAADLTLAAGGNFINSAGASALSVGTGRWLVWSTNPANDTRDGLTYDFKQYNATYGVSTVAQSTGNGFLYTLAPSVTPTLQGTVSRTYDGTTTATLTAGNFATSGAVDGDTVAIGTVTSGNYDTANVDTGKAITVTGLSPGAATNGTATVYGYQLGATSITGNIGTITPATLTYTANAASRTYGAANPAFSGTVTGFVNRESLGSSTTGTAEFTSTATTASNAGSYAIDGSGLTANNGNYVFVQAAGNATALTIDPATLTYTADAVSRTYGAANPAFSGAVTGFVNGQDLTSATTGVLAFDSAATTATNAGSYAIDGSGLAANNGNYVFAQAAGNATALTISPATLTYTATAASRTYGASNPAFAGSLSGFVNGQDQTSVTTGTLAFGSAADANSNVGSYAIDGSGLTANNGNYVFAQAAGNATALTINPATLTYTATAVSRTYGAGNPTFTGSLSGFVNGQDQTSATTGTLAFGSAADASSNVGSYAIDGSGLTANNGNYVFAQAAGNATALTINPATLTYTADVVSRSYGANNPAFTGAVIGFVNGEDVASATTGALAFDSAATTASNAGSYAIDGSGLTANNDNYVFDQAAGNATALTIAPKNITVTATGGSSIYGASPTNPGFTASGLVNSQDESVLTGLANNFAITNTTNADSYTLAVTGTLTNGNYNVTTRTDGTWVVSPKDITVTATGGSSVYGASPTNPGFTASGLVNSQDESVLTGLANNFAITNTTNAASYTLAVTGTLTNGNYNVTTRTDGTWVVSPKDITVTATGGSSIYGASPTNPGFTASGLANSQDESVLTGLANNFAITNTTNAASYTLAVTGTLTNGNYNVTTRTDGTWVVNPRGLTISAVADQTKIYGNADPVFAYTTGGLGLVNGDTLSGALGRAAGEAAGSYALSQGSLSASDNYTVTFNGGTFAITRRPIVLSADLATKRYGSTDPELGVSIVGGSLGSITVSDTLADVTGNLGRTTGENVGNYDLVLGTGTRAANYDITFAVDGTTALKIDPAPLTVKADAASKTYGATNPAFTASYDGFVFDQDASVLGGTLAFATPATQSSDVGTYAITPSGLTSTNYALTFTDGALTVNAAPLTITANNASRTYGAADPAFSATYLGFVLGQDASALGGTLSLTTPATASSPSGNYAITPGGHTSTNYAITFVPGTLSIDLATLTITAADATKLYGAALPAFGVSYSGFASGDTASGLGGSLSFTTAATESSDVGSYSVLPAGYTSDKYAITFMPGTLSVTPAPLVVKANDVARVFRNANPPLSASYAGFVLGQNESVLGGSLALDTTAAVDSPVGSYAITAAGLTSSNYAITFEEGVLSIGKALLTVRADDAAKAYGAALPKFTASFSGFETGDTAENSVSGALTFATSATAGSNAGTYTITPGGVTSSNYAIQFEPGTLTISPVALSILAGDASRLYGAANPAFTASYTGFVNGDAPASLNGTLTFATSATAASGVGTYAVTPGGVASPNYTIVFQPGTLTISPAALTIAAADARKIYGAANPAFAANYSGFVNGDTAASLGGALVFETAATVGSGVGSYAITPSGAAAANYTIDYISGRLTIDPASLTIAANDATRAFGVANPGFSASFSGFVNGETESVVSGLTLNTPATTQSPAGSYPITPAGATASNYVITFLPGKLDVTQVVVDVDDTPVEVPTVDGEPAITDDFAVVARGDSLVLIPVNGTVGTGSSVGGGVTATLSDTVVIPRSESEFVAGSTATGGVLPPGANPGGGQVVAVLGGGPAGAGSGGSLSLANVPSDQNLLRETSVAMGGFNVVYRESVDEVRQIDQTNTAFGSSFHEFLDSETPQTVIVRGAPGERPEDRENNRDAGAQL